jgi:putative protease
MVVKKKVKKAVKKTKSAKKPIAKAKGEAKKEKLVGKVSHFFDKISVVVIELTGALKVGDIIRIKGNTTNFEQKVESIQIEHEQVKEAKAGQGIGLKVKEPARVNDSVYFLN